VCVRYGINNYDWKYLYWYKNIIWNLK
jgi:hypothetical protein